MKPYKLYLFDLDGTTIDSDQMIIETFRELYPLYRPGFNPPDNYILQFSGPQMVDTLKNEFPNYDLDFMIKEYKRISEKHYPTCVKLFSNVWEMFEIFTKNHINFGVVTNKFRFATEYSYKLLGINNFNIYSVCADDVKNYKPAGDGIIEAMKRFNIKNKDEVLYVGDNYIDYLTAKNAGVKFAFVSWSPRKLDPKYKIDEVIDNYLSFAEEIVK